MSTQKHLCRQTIKVIFACICSCIVHGKTISQRILNTDSLKQILDTHPSRDSNRVKTLIAYGTSIEYKDLSIAVSSVDEALEISNSLNWDRGRFESNLALGELNIFAARYDNATKFFLTCLRMAEQNGDKYQQANAVTSLSETYRLLSNNDDLAEKYALQYLELGKQLNDSSIILRAYVNLARFYPAEQKEKVELYTRQGLAIAIARKDSVNEVRLLEVRADELYAQEQYSEAAVIYKKILKIWQGVGNMEAVAWIQLNLGGLYLGARLKDSAYLYGYAALKTAKDQHLQKELKDTYRVLIAYHYNYGDYKTAFDYQQIYDSLHQEQYNVKTTQNTERAKFEYEQEKKDAIVQAVRDKEDAKQSRTKILLISAFGIFAIIAGFLFYSNRQKQKAKSKIEQAYASLKSTQQQLIQSEKMASLGELTAGIAHEIQNPLNFVNNFSEVSKELLEEMKEAISRGDNKEANELATDVIENLVKITTHGQRADGIVKGMLQHSRHSSGQKELIDINNLCDEYLRLAYHGLRAKDKSFNADFDTDLDKTIGKINVLPQELGRVILNLINNAFYAVSEKSSQSVPGYRPTVKIVTRKSANNAEIRIEDNGNGIPSEIIDKIFQPFFTTKPTGQGTGLGLSISYDIVKAHGGELKVASSTAGTIFTIQLPLTN